MTQTILSETSISTDLKPSLLAQWSILRAVALVFLMCAAGAVTLSAQTVTTLLTFDGTDGSSKIAPMIQSTDGNFYGTTEDGGTTGGGTIFKLTPQGNLTTLYDFCIVPGCGGSTPMAALTRGTDGNLYGTTFIGGNSLGCNGTAFKITPQGTLTTLYNFCTPSSSGQLPEASLVQAQDGNFYGTTYDGGSLNVGTLFQMTPQGQLTTVHSFCTPPTCADGAFPEGPGLLLGADGNLYGITGGGGAYDLQVDSDRRRHPTLFFLHSVLVCGWD